MEYPETPNDAPRGDRLLLRVLFCATVVVFVICELIILAPFA